MADNIAVVSAFTFSSIDNTRNFGPVPTIKVVQQALAHDKIEAFALAIGLTFGETSFLATFHAFLVDSDRVIPRTIVNITSGVPKHACFNARVIASVGPCPF